VSTGYRQLLLIVGLGLSLVLYAAVDGSHIQKSAAETLVPSDTVSLKPMLRWHKVAGAVSYEVELFKDAPVNTGNQSASSTAFYSTKKIYVTGFNADLSADFAGPHFYWRVRGLDVSGAPLGDFSEPKQVMLDRKTVPLQKPIPTSIFNQSPGSTLLYPVYAWIPVAGAIEYEVEILAARPENPNGVVPSMHRIDSGIAVGFDYYDEKPRQSQQSFWWRVRGLDRNGDPVGVYSDAGEFQVNPRLPVTVATFGDSITHGGGDVSYSPADWEYSYQNYLMFPTINLGRSSDTSETMAARFEQDVVPFQPQYLLIMGGTNSLRAGVSAQSVIEDLMAIKEKALANEIRPVFLTIPPINPANINSVFAEATVADWQRQFAVVNDFIRTQEHIDVAAGMADSDGTLPDQLGIDGLHLGIAGKRKIAAAVNANWRRITQRSAPMAQMSLDDKTMAD
jgi:lysophospholipase L1-like esterase